MRKCDASAAQKLQPGMRKCDARAARRSEPYTQKPTHRAHAGTQGRQGAPPARVQPGWAVASINVESNAPCTPISESSHAEPVSKISGITPMLQTGGRSQHPGCTPVPEPVAAGNPRGLRHSKVQRHGQSEWRVTSINVDRLSQAKWTKLTQYLALQSPPVIACAIQHHQLHLWAELDDGEYEFWGNECGVGAKEGAAGGVGWAVHRKYKHMFTEHTGRGEGPNVKWLKMNHDVYLVSVYVPPGVAHTAAANDLMAHMVATQHMPCIWMGDVNIHFDGDSPLQAAWEGMCVRSRMTALDMEGVYAQLPTRTPRGFQNGEPSHIDTVTATHAACRVCNPAMCRIGTDTSIDDADGDTDHKLLMFTLQGTNRRRRVSYVTSRWLVSQTQQHPQRKLAYKAGLQADTQLGAPVVGVSQNITGGSQLQSPIQGAVDAAHDRLATALHRNAEAHIGRVTVKVSEKARFTSAAVTQAYSAHVKEYKRYKRILADPAASQVAKLAAKEARRITKKTFRANIRRIKADHEKCILQKAAETGNLAKKTHAAYARLTKSGSNTTAPGDRATMDYEGVKKSANTHAEVAELISQYTRMVSQDDINNTDFDPQFRDAVERAVRSLKSTAPYRSHDDSPLNAPITRDEISVALKSMRDKLYKSAGPDGVQNWMLVWGGDAVVGALHALYTAVWDTGVIPTQWMDANITYIWKKKGSKQEVSNYRPISLTSVIGKLFTKILLPRLDRVVAPELSEYQGCAKPGSGAVEHLWAFQAIIQRNLDTPVYALFADIHKAYDQVWRDGLYFALFCAGIRGRAWHFIVTWLDRATATPKWNGTVGTRVQLEQGLRQGCVLSPLLYCLFINTMMTTGPACEMPPSLCAVTKQFFAHGLAAPISTHGGVLHRHFDRCSEVVKAPHNDDPINTFLFMDDTTLLAKSKRGLQHLTARYLNFCSKFRMRVNPTKTTLMKFTATGEWEPVEITARGKTFSTPKRVRPDGTWEQKILGYHCDPSLSGRSHFEAAVKKSKRQLYKIDPIAHRLGEEHALQYIQTHIAPSVLYASEMMDMSMARQLDKQWENLLAEATLTGKANKWWSDEPYIRRAGLRWHTAELPWSVQVQKKKAMLNAKLNTATTGLAADIYHHRSWRCLSDLHLKPGKQLLAEASVGDVIPASTTGRAKWKSALNRHLTDQQLNDLAVFKNLPLSDRSDSLMVATLGNTAGQAKVWQQLLPCTPLRIKAHKLKLGVLPFTKHAQAQRKEVKRHWPLLTQQNRSRLLQCQCGHSPQTATHLWNECPLACQHLSANLCSPQDLPKFLRAVFSPDVQLPKHQLIRTLVHNYETLGNNMGTTTDSMLQAVTAAIAEQP